MSAFIHLVYSYRFAIAVTSWYVFTCFIIALPAKGAPYCFYDHMYDFTHQILNIKPIPGLSDKR